MNKKMTGLLVCAALATTWMAFRWNTEDSAVSQLHSTSLSTITTAGTTSRPRDSIGRTEQASAEQLQSRFEHFMANRPPYLAGIDMPGRYSVDDDGNLIFDTGMKDMLDFFFLAVGDLSPGQIHDLIAGSMIASLQEPARSQALAFLDRYFSYIDAYDQWHQSFDKDVAVASDPASMQQHLAELEDLRRRQLGDEAYDAFFAESDRVNAAYMEARIALRQPNLTQGDKAAIREQLSDALPPDVRQAQQAAMTLITLEEKISQLQSQGASAQEIFQARAALVGEDAAQRLAQADEEQNLWTQKRDQYINLVHATSGLDAMTSEERQNYIADLAQRELGLNASEIKRMQALDRIEAEEAVQ
jgi:lipase chaperone LimK